MRSLTESPALLSVHAGTDGQYILRISDLQYRPLLVSVSKLLPEARSLVVVTPSDIKVFSVGGGNGDMEAAAGDLHNPIVDVDTAEPVFDPETLAAIESAEEESPPRTRRRKPAETTAGHDEPCGRCRGAGMVAIALDNGAASETVCPVCKGTKLLRRYGVRR